MAFLWKDKKTATWYLDYTPDGGKRVRKRIGKSRQAAELALKEINYQLSFDRAGVSTPNVTLGDFFSKYEETVKSKLRPKSWKRYRAIIDHFELSAAIHAIVGGDSGPARKPAADMLLHACALVDAPVRRAIMVGDSSADVGAAHAAGMASIAVLGGYTTVPVADLGAHVVIDTLNDLPAAIERLKSET